mgnify:CR=1 FL=1
MNDSNMIITNVINEGDQNNIKICINADTDLEKVFYQKCAQDNRKIQIYYEWQNNKNRYIHQTAIIAHDFPNYSVHDQEHSRTIIESIEMLLGKWRIERFGIGNAWLLLNAAYGHDIGMVIQHQEALELWRDDREFQKYLDNICNNPESDMQEALQYCRQLHNVLHNKEKLDGIDDSGNVFQIYELTNDWPVVVKKNVMMITADYIRSHHEERSKKFFENLSKTIGIEVAENRLYNLLGKVVYSHGRDLDYIFTELPKETNGFGTEKIYPQFIALLLRIGDLLDMDNNRFDIMLLQHFGALPRTSMKHLQKHLSISHFLVTERKIQAKAHTTDYEVCKIVDQWFRYIKDEMKNITSNWNRVAPEEMGGCTFNHCNLEIFLNGEKYESFGKTRFEVDNKRFMSVLIGDKLYEEQLVFLREYIQNAMDATKLMLWLKWKKEENMHVFIADENGHVDETLSSLDSVNLKDYAIKVGLELVQEDEYSDSETAKGFSPEVLRIHIIDSGVGMDEECLKALAVIGTGWSGRKKYFEEIGRMPTWMQPTGSFGIGIQSGFMMTDKIRIVTRGMNEKHGLDIQLYSPRQTGKINYFFVSDNRVGTELILDVDWADFLNKLQKSGQYAKILKADNGVFNYDTILQDVKKCLIKYIGQLIPNSFIPVRVATISKTSSKFEFGEAVDSYVQKFLTSKSAILRDSGSNIDYTLNNDMNLACFWMREEQVFVQMENLLKELPQQIIEDEFCYKGVLVKNRDTRNENKVNLISRYIPVSMDIMGMSASDCLLISRSHFTEEMKGRFEEWAWKCFKLYTEIVAKRIKELSLKNQLSNVEKNPENSYLMLMGTLYFGKNQDTAYICEQNLLENNTYVTLNLRKDSKRYRLEESKHVTFNEIYKWFSSEDTMIVWKADRAAFSDEVRTTLNFVSIMNEEDDEPEEEMKEAGRRVQGIREKTENYLKKTVKTEAGSNYIITDERLVNILEEFIEKNGINRELFKIQNIAQEDVILSVYDPEYELKKEKDTDTKEESNLRETLITAIGKEQYYIVVDRECDRKYSGLYVREVPINDDLTEEYLKNHKVILFPFNKDIYSLLKKLFLNSNIPDGADIENAKIEREQKFWDYILNNSVWERAVQWTMKHGINKKGFQQRNIVAEQYKELCREFWKAYIDYDKKQKVAVASGKNFLNKIGE